MGTVRNISIYFEAEQEISFESEQEISWYTLKQSNDIFDFTCFLDWNLSRWAFIDNTQMYNITLKYMYCKVYILSTNLPVILQKFGSWNYGQIHVFTSPTYLSMIVYECNDWHFHFSSCSFNQKNRYVFVTCFWKDSFFKNAVREQIGLPGAHIWS